MTYALSYALKMRRLDAWLIRYPWASLLVIALLSSVLYGLATRAPWGVPYDIGPTRIDAYIPYLWWTIPAYLTYYLVLPCFAWLNQHTAAFAPIWWRALAYILCNLAITLCVPTRVHPWALAEQSDFWARLITMHDTPLAAIPSAHVGLPCCLWLSMKRFGGKGTAIFGAWTLVFAISILTTKQHYVWDLLAGLALAASIAFAPRIVQPQKPA